MAETDPQTEPQPAQHDALEHGTYEVIRNRLKAAGEGLRGRLEKLNAARRGVFGAIETALLATERVTTAHHCVPRDMVAVGDRLLFGYNVHLGLKLVASPGDVFSVYRFRDRAFTEQPLELIADAQFARDFTELFKYYRKTVFDKFAVIGPHLFMVFRIGDDPRDVKTFKWLVKDDRLVYVDNRSDHEYRFPRQHEFQWTRTHRDMHSQGLHPHVSIEDRVFVETTEGDLTIKVENNTDTGEGIYAEPVDNPDQTLDDAEFFYAIVGNLILLKILPYQEQKHRHFIFCEKTQQVLRLDSIADACVLLPDDHGVILANGYVLQTGEYKLFDTALSGMTFAERIQAPNGEDYLYVFYNRAGGDYVLLAYNLIEQKVDLPVICKGYSFFQNGEMVYFKAQSEPQRHHALQIWQTPFVGRDFQPPAQQTESFLYKIGNRDIVRGMAECHELLNLIAKEDTYANLFVDLAKTAGDVLDAYYWLDHAETFNLREDIAKIKEAAEAAIAEFEKVVSIRRATKAELDRVTRRAAEIARHASARRFEVIGDFVDSLVDLRGVRGEIISLRSLRYVDVPAVDALEKDAAEQTERIAQRSVAFLLNPQSLQPYEKAVAEHAGKIDGVAKASEARGLGEKIDRSAGELEMLIEIVSNLKIDDATQRTAIVDAISAVFARLNQARSALRARMRDLMKVEGAAEFASQLKLLGQGVVNYLDVCDTPDKCEEYLTKMMVQIEELEGKFAEFDEFVGQLVEKRESIHDAFESRKLQLVEARNQRAAALAAAAERILGGVKVRAGGFKTVNEINGYFAGDLMVDKVRTIVADLLALGDTVKADDLQSRMKTIHEDAVRQLKDRQDLYEDGDNVIRLGKHKFSVNNQAFDLTTVPRDGLMCFHLAGTAFFQPIDDPEFLATRGVWSQEVVSENAEVYRGEYLAYQIYCHGADEGRTEGAEGTQADGTRSVPATGADGTRRVPATFLAELRGLDSPQLAALVQRLMGPRYAEGYVKGVHDHDAAIILAALVRMDATIGLLRFHPRARALAQVFWRQFRDEEERALITAQLRGFGAVRTVFPAAGSQAEYIAKARLFLREYVDRTRLFPATLVDSAGAYLFEELTRGAKFVISSRARDLYRAFHAHLEQKHVAEAYRRSIEEVRTDPNAAFSLQRDWVAAFLATRNDPAEGDYADETAALLATGSFDVARVHDAPVVEDLHGMVGDHPVIRNKTYRLDYNAFMLKLEAYERDVAPRFDAYVRLKRSLLERERDRMRLDEFRPRVLTSFVRNRLIDRVYLPLLGDNLAKQIGVTGQQKRTDRMGLLLLISPPGYGKTTLMEYLANRLGLVFMKINGPALGVRVTSLDPLEAPNAAAREEMEKLNLAFEMGDNVMIYVDDIQHCNPEFLQKFISLCDAQRKIEGVYRGKTRTYDLRGKKVCVVMAGNPYTESGEKFKIPDMLANRADTYNLGEIIGDSADLFEMSYLENALTSNPVLNKLATRSQADSYAVMKIARGESTEGIELEGSYSTVEINEMVSVMRKLMRVRDVVLRVNREYIDSAGMADDYRVEPPFKLQGSYRNMNRIAERVVAVMNDKELDELVFANYQNDAQTLATGAESNLLKFKELVGRLTDDERARWEHVKRTYSRNVQLRGIGDDQKFGQIILQMTNFSESLDAIKSALKSGVAWMVESGGAKDGRRPPALQASFDPQTLDKIGALVDELKAQFAARALASGEESLPREIHVVNKVPAAILGVLRQQFELMQGWLKPIADRTQEQGNDVDSLRQLIDKNLAAYQDLIARIEEAVRKKDLLYEDLARNKVATERPPESKKGSGRSSRRKGP